MGKTEAVRSAGGWHPGQPDGELEDFFIRAKRANLKVATCDVYVSPTTFVK